jgi:hypothetical protein
MQACRQDSRSNQRGEKRGPLYLEAKQEMARIAVTLAPAGQIATVRGTLLPLHQLLP